MTPISPLLAFFFLFGQTAVSTATPSRSPTPSATATATETPWHDDVVTITWQCPVPDGVTQQGLRLSNQNAGPTVMLVLPDGSTVACVLTNVFEGVPVGGLS